MNIKKLCREGIEDIVYKYLFCELLHRIMNCRKLQIPLAHFHYTTKFCRSWEQMLACQGIADLHLMYLHR